MASRALSSTIAARTFVNHRRAYSSPSHPPPSPHAQWYHDLAPAMLPIALLGSAVYLGLHLLQNKLSNEKYVDEAKQRIAELEARVDELQRKNASGGLNAKVQSVVSGSRSWFSWK